MMRSIWLGSLICLTAACSPDSEERKPQALASDEGGSDAKLSSGNCSTIPADFRSSREFASNPPTPPSRELKNLIKIRADRSITWNGEEVSKSVLEANLRVVPQFYPVPLTTLDFDAGTPCPLIDEVRELMRRHLQCGDKAVCLQGGGES
jgi:hypothetical protein